MLSSLLRIALHAVDALERPLWRAQTIQEVDASLAALDAAVARLHGVRDDIVSRRRSSVVWDDSPCTQKRPRDALDDAFDAPMRLKGARRDV